jgi:hypothetical protein
MPLLALTALTVEDRIGEKIALILRNPEIIPHNLVTPEAFLAKPLVKATALLWMETNGNSSPKPPTLLKPEPNRKPLIKILLRFLPLCHLRLS